MTMANSFKDIEPNECYFFDGPKGRVFDRVGFQRLLSDTIFSPCPMGNVILETFRVYESLEMGCIPIVERRRRMAYYDRLMPGHPLPTFASWPEAGEFVKMMSNDKSKLIATQHAIAEWWYSYKAQLRSDVASFVSLGLDGSFRSSLSEHWHSLKGISHWAWRLAELLKHGSRASLGKRMLAQMSSPFHS
jgi:hypothetical protein